jgi:hypothetical protein
VHLDHAQVLVQVAAAEGAANAKAGVVDQDFQVRQGGDLFFHCLHAGRVVQVGGQRFGLDGVTLAEFGGQGLQALQAAGGQHQVVALGGQLAGKFGAQPAGSAGNQGSFACGHGRGITRFHPV